VTPVVPVPAGYRAGGWTVLRHIADGSWSSVYAARRRHRLAALKFLRPCRDATGQETAFHERIHHRYVIRSYGSFVIDDAAQPELHGTTVLSTELAALSLRDRLAAARPGSPGPGGVRMVEQICEALAHVHSRHWVHGDLKPGNILLMPDGTVRLCDFGLAQELDGTHADVPPLGSADFLPPEWWTERIGVAGVTIRPTADIWALGVTAHQILTGGLHPFPGLSARARRAAAQSYAAGRAGLDLADGLAPRWRALIADCLAPNHAARLRHPASALLRRLRTASTAPMAA
jgi:serine/threonine protein kinase